MTDTNKPTGPDEKPPVAGADDIERLLIEAERLSEELASDAGASPEAGEGRPVRLDAPAGDDAALAATAEVAAKIADLGTALGSEKNEGSSQEAGSSIGTPDEEFARDGGEESESAAMADANQTEGADQSDPGDAGGKVSPGESSSAELAPSPADQEAAPARTFREQTVAVCRFCLAGLRFAVKTPLLVCGVALGAIDRPFAGLSPSTKRYIGYVAIATLIIGLASIIVPPMLRHNPYLKLTH